MRHPTAVFITILVTLALLSYSIHLLREDDQTSFVVLLLLMLNGYVNGYLLLKT